MSRANDDEWPSNAGSLLGKWTGEMVMPRTPVVSPLQIADLGHEDKNLADQLYKELAQFTHYGTPGVGLTVRLADVEEAIRKVAGV